LGAAKTLGRAGARAGLDGVLLGGGAGARLRLLDRPLRPRAVAVAEPLGEVVAALIGPAGSLFLLALMLPLERPSHGAEELRRAGGALLIRLAAAPLELLACGLAVGASLPAVF